MRLLVASGGSLYSDLALQLAGLIAANARIAPTLLTVVRRPGEGAGGAPIRERARRVVGPAAEDWRVVVRSGDPGEEITAEARGGQYDLVIVGQRPRHFFMSRFLGSTSAHVVEHAPCPVIVAKGEIRPIRHILLCDSGAESKALLTRFISQVAALAQDDSEVTVLHVMSQITAGPGVNGMELKAEAEQLMREHTPEGLLLEEDVRSLSLQRLRPRAKVRHGLVIEEILAEAHDEPYDLVVIGAHRGDGWQRFLLDDIARQYVVQVNRPVLVLR
jgi:nucleotide-binding universal stress UspA family protein